VEKEGSKTKSPGRASREGTFWPAEKKKGNLNYQRLTGVAELTTLWERKYVENTAAFPGRRNLAKGPGLASKWGGEKLGGEHCLEEGGTGRSQPAGKDLKRRSDSREREE